MPIEKIEFEWSDSAKRLNDVVLPNIYDKINEIIEKVNELESRLNDSHHRHDPHVTLR